MGESGGDSSSVGTSAKIIQWDTGVSCGELGQHSRGRVLTCDLNNRRPMRCITAGEDTKIIFNGNTPFSRIVVPSESNVGQAGHTREVNCIRFSPDSVWICSVGGDKTLRLYHGKLGNCVYEATNVHDAAVYACAWSNDSKFLLTCSADGKAKLWSVGGSPDDVTTFDLAHTWNVVVEETRQCGLFSSPSPISPTSATSPTSKINIPKGGMQCGCAFVYENQPVVVGVNGHLTLLPKPECLGGATNHDTASSFITITGHQENIETMALDSVTRTKLYTGDIDGIIVEWDLTSGKSTRVLPRKSEEDYDSLFYKVHRGAITGLVTMPNGEVCSIGWDDTVRYSSRTGVGDKLHCTGSTKLSSQPNAISQGRNLVVIVTAKGLVFSYHHQNHVALSEMDLPYSALSAAVSRDDTSVAIGTNRGDIYIYDVCNSGNGNINLKETHVLNGAHFKSVSALSFSDDKSMLASADVRDVCIWKARENYSPIINKNRWCFHTQKIQCLSWAPNGKILASGGLDDSIYLWSLDKKMTRIGYPFAHRGGVVGIEFMTGGRCLVSAGKDGCVCQWDVEEDVRKKFGVSL